MSFIAGSHQNLSTSRDDSGDAQTAEANDKRDTENKGGITITVEKVDSLDHIP